MARKWGIIVVCLAILQFSINLTNIEAAVFDNSVKEKKTIVAPDVTHILENYQTGSTKEVVNILDINLNNPYTKMEVGLPNPLNSLKTTSSTAKENSYEGHRVVGAVNASYFFGNGPTSLIAQNNKIVNYGVLGEKYDSPTQKPVAFGVDKNGKAIADYYATNLSFTVNGKTYPLNLIDSERTTDKNVLYTSAKKTTGTNQWGMEIVVKNSSKSTKEVSFGDSFTGNVSSVTKYGEPGNSAIPEDGFVISVQNKTLAAELSTLPADTPIEVKIDIEDKWKDAQFILAAGPLLVKDGKVNISMPNDSSFATTRSDRTAVAVDATGTRVFLVTVDGRQSGYSNGTSLKDLASMLIAKGAKYAINLDGGGSTTMVVRQPYTTTPVVVNQSSDGRERRVSAILQVVNTAPKGTVKKIKLSQMDGDILKGSTLELQAAQAFDEYMNPVTVNQADIKWTLEGNIGKIEGAQFTATAKGTGKIFAEYEGARSEINVNVVDLGEKPISLDSFDKSSAWSSEVAKAKGSVANSASSEPYRQGTASLKLDYDFTTGETGTKAVYAVAKTPLPILGLPHNIGVWVYGDGGNHWLRGILVDGSGEKHTINFTEQGELNWTGWKYVTAKLPESLPLPLKFERIYITEPTTSYQNKGRIYLDQLQAVYTDNHEELVYTDVKKGFWGYGEITKLNERGLIKGYPDGTFKPDNTITRAEAATIIAREFNLKATKSPSFKDLKSTHYAYNEIAAVAEKGIITGREAGSFSPDGKLTRAEMATILTRAYNLTGTTTAKFPDVTSKHWAYKNIQIIIANKLTEGYDDGTFKPDRQISRAEFAAFLDRISKK